MGNGVNFMVLNKKAMKYMRMRNIYVEVVSAILIVLFVYVAVSKLLDHYYFQSVLGNSPLIGDAKIIVSWLIPVIELVISALLLIPMYRSKGLLSATILLIVFTLYIAYLLIFVPELPCSCGGILNKLSWPAHLEVNGFLTFLSFSAWTLNNRNKRFIAINRIRRTPV